MQMMVIYSAAPPIELAVQNLQSDFLIIQQALIDLKLVLNTDKTKYLIFSQKPAARLYNGVEYKLKEFFATNTWAFGFRINLILNC